MCDILTRVGTALSDILTEVVIALYDLDTGRYRIV